MLGENILNGPNFRVKTRNETYGDWAFSSIKDVKNRKQRGCEINRLHPNNTLSFAFDVPTTVQLHEIPLLFALAKQAVKNVRHLDEITF